MVDESVPKTLLEWHREVCRLSGKSLNLFTFDEISKAKSDGVSFVQMGYTEGDNIVTVADSSFMISLGRDGFVGVKTKEEIERRKTQEWQDENRRVWGMSTEQNTGKWLHNEKLSFTVEFDYRKSVE